MEKQKIEVKRFVSYEEAVGYLEDLVKCFKERKIIVQQGDQSLTLLPAESVELEVEAKQKKDKSKVSLEISWVGGPAEEEGDVLTISSETAEKTNEEERSMHQESKGKREEVIAPEKATAPSVPAAKPEAAVQVKTPAPSPAKADEKKVPPKQPETAGPEPKHAHPSPAVGKPATDKKPAK